MAAIVESLEKAISGIKVLNDHGIELKGQAIYLKSLEDKLAALTATNSVVLAKKPKNDILHQDPNACPVIGTPGRSMLKIKVRNENGELSFKINEQAPMSVVKKSFARKIGVDEQRLGFYFDGCQRIEDKQTPKSLGLKDGAVVEVYPVVYSRLSRFC